MAKTLENLEVKIESKFYEESRKFKVIITTYMVDDNRWGRNVSDPVKHNPCIPAELGFDLGSNPIEFGKILRKTFDTTFQPRYSEDSLIRSEFPPFVDDGCNILFDDKVKGDTFFKGLMAECANRGIEPVIQNWWYRGISATEKDFHNNTWRKKVRLTETL